MLTIHVCVRDSIFLADDVYRDERGRREEEEGCSGSGAGPASGESSKMI